MVLNGGFGTGMSVQRSIRIGPPGSGVVPTTTGPWFWPGSIGGASVALAIPAPEMAVADAAAARMAMSLLLFMLLPLPGVVVCVSPGMTRSPAGRLAG